jgi:hypothetical protein
LSPKKPVSKKDPCLRKSSLREVSSERLCAVSEPHRHVSLNYNQRFDADKLAAVTQFKARQTALSAQVTQWVVVIS